MTDRVRQRLSALLVSTLVALSVASATAPGAGAQARSIDDACPTTVPDDGFSDIAPTNGHERAIDCLVWWEVTKGVESGRYDPEAAVTRGQSASFVARSIDRSGVALGVGARDAFDDDDGTTHEQSTNRLADAGIVRGTAPRRYSPTRLVTRAELAAMLVRALEYLTGAPLSGGPDAFDDDDGTTHEDDINRAAAAGIAAGSGNRTFRPTAPVRRDEMASFLARVLDLIVERRMTPVPVESSSFGGNEGQRSSEFRLRSGDYVVRWTYHDTRCSHIATIEATDGDRVAFEDLPDDDGGSSGRASVTVPADEYILQMSITPNGSTSCPWQVTIGRP